MSLALVFHEPGDDTRDALQAATWRADAFDFWAFDRRADDLVARGEPLHVVVAADEREIIHQQIAIRTQRLADTRNPESATAWFSCLLAEHAALHDVAKPLVRADLDHALDTWQWSLRLDPAARAAVQVAALLHDIERLASEADARIEHRAADYQAFKDAHARAGAELARDVLARAGVPREIAEHACALVAGHERPDASPELRAVNDADALSFFSLNSPGYLAYFGSEQTARKIAYTLARMSPAARRWLPAVRMPRFVRERCVH